MNIDKSFGPMIERTGLRRALTRVGLLGEIQSGWEWPTNITRMDVTKDWPWPDGSAEAIYSSHMLEHLTKREAEGFLRKCFRVLRPGGILRLAVPDLESAVEDYLNKRNAGEPRAADELNQLFYSMSDFDRDSTIHRFAIKTLHRPHQWIYDFDSLGSRMRDAGFESITKSAFKDGRLPEVERMDVREDSLFIEGIHP